jgi:hypothetical protein
VREYVPRVFELEPTRTCAVDGDVMKFRCHSFLRIYVQAASFGRSALNFKKMCDGNKKADSNEPSQDCLSQSRALEKMRDQCHGRSSCQQAITPDFTTLDSSCDGLKREARVDHICGRIATSIVTTVSSPLPQSNATSGTAMRTMPPPAWTRY